MVLNEKDLLQANVTAIAGILVLFTITSVIPTSQQLQYKGMVAAPVGLFSASSLFLIFYNDMPEEKRKAIVTRCGYVTVGGFFMLVITLLVLQYTPAPNA